MQSPMANTPGAAVRKWLSTGMWPLASVAMPMASSPSPSVFGTPADGHEHAIAADRLGPDAFDHATRPFRSGRRDTRAEAKFDSLLLEQLMGVAGKFAVGAGQDPIEKLQHRDFRPKPIPDRAEFQADISAADDHQMLGHFLIRKGLGAGADAVAVELDAGQRRRLAAGGDEDVWGGRFRWCRPPLRSARARRRRAGPGRDSASPCSS